MYLNLESHVQAIVLPLSPCHYLLPQLTQAASGTPDYNTILKQLTRVYDDPKKVQEAEDKLYALKQGTDSLSSSTYLPTLPGSSVPSIKLVDKTGQTSIGSPPSAMASTR